MTTKHPHPPGPKTAPMGLDIAEKLKRDPLNLTLSLREEFGDIVYMKLGPYDWYLLNHPDQVKEVFVTRAKQFGKTDSFKRVLGSIDGKGLVLSEGDYWLRQRRIIQPAFHHEMLKTYAEIMVSETERRIASWKDGDSIDLTNEMTKLTLTVAARVFFDVDLSSEAQELGDAVTSISRVIYKEFSEIFPMPDWLPIPSKLEKRRAVEVIDTMLRRVIAQRRADPSKVDFLSMLLTARDVEGDNALLTDQEVRDEAITMFNAGHDSTAASLSWAWYLLLKNPTIYSQLIADVDSNTSSSIDMAALHAVPLAGQVAKEAIRMYPAAWIIPRQTTEELELCGYTLAKGSLVNPMPWVIHHDERFFENHNEFRPQRFSHENESKLYPFAYFPFGAGPRGCIGKEFALMEMQLIMISICRKFRFEFQPGHELVTPNPLISLEPKEGVKVVVRKRHNVAV